MLMKHKMTVTYTLTNDYNKDDVIATITGCSCDGCAEFKLIIDDKPLVKIDTDGYHIDEIHDILIKVLTEADLQVKDNLIEEVVLNIIKGVVTDEKLYRNLRGYL